MNLLRPVYTPLSLEQVPIHQIESQIRVERDRIAHLLHDSLAQDLVFMNSQAAAVRKLLAQGDHSRALEQISLLEEVSQSLAGDIRSLIDQLHQPELPADDLQDALQELTNRFSRRSQIRVNYEAPSSFSTAHLSPQAKSEIYFIVQEALVNIRKHAAADTAWVQLVDGEVCLDVIVRDDGCGLSLPTPDLAPRRHYGFPIMQARARTIGARLKIEEPPERGTQLTLCIPHQTGR